ncbi:unnamed protein product [Rhodiola kirilowii]
MDGITKTQDVLYSGMPSSVVFNNLQNSMQADGLGVGYTNISQQNSVSFSTASKGMKRKWNAFDESMGIDVGSSLRLGLGSSSSSSDSKGSSMTPCTSFSSAKENEESSMDIDLDFSLHLGNEKLPCSKVYAGSDLNPMKEQPQVDLELSLSFGTAESTVTCVSPRSKRYAMDIQCPAFHNSHAYYGAESVHVNTGLSILPLSTVNAPILTSSITTVPKNPITSIFEIPQPQYLHSGNSKTCQIEGCGKGARGASGRCITHGGGWRCKKPGCVKGAEGRTVYCKAHGGGRRCDFLGCTKSAEGRTDLCISHGGGRRCSAEGCTRAARANSALCISHGGGKRCRKENCTKSAEGRLGLCISHGGGPRCQYPNCSKGAQGRMFCKAHGGGKRCTYEGCLKGAEGSTPFCKGHGGGKRCTFQGGGVCPKSVHGGTQFCVKHGGGKRCAVQGCTTSARGKTAYCVRHGGGKRCQVANCDKSAQGSTDFCKAHGKRCRWGHPDSEFSEMPAPCNALVRGKNGLCASHSALVLDKRVHGGGTLGSIILDPKSSTPEDHAERDVMITEGVQLNPTSNIHIGLGVCGSSEAPSWFPEVALPCSPLPGLNSEGRVHKGSLMSMLRGKAHALGLEGRKSSMTPQSWI